MADNVSKWVGVAGLAVTAGTMIWQMSGIAHDVSEVRESLVDMRADEKGMDARVYALEARVVRIEASVNLKERTQ